MNNWFSKNYKTLIIAAFLIPIITVAIVSISHVTKWYGISNPVTWSVYLSIGVEIAALSALAAISANMGKKVYFPFAIVTLVQFIGNIFFAYSYIQIGSEPFKQWVELVSPLVEFMGVEPTDFVGHKRFLAFFAGGMLPIISLSFLHMLVKFTEEDRLKQSTQDKPKEEPTVDPSEFARVHLSENDLKVLEEALLNPPPPNEALINAAEKYKEMTDEEILKKAEQIKLQRTWDIVTKVTRDREEKFGPTNPEDEPVGALANSEYREKSIFPEEVEYSDEYNKPVYTITENPTQEERRQILIDMMQQDQELGLYDEPFDNPMVEEPNEVVPALSDEEVREMFMDEWENKYDLVEEDEEPNYVPSFEEQNQNFNSFVVPVVNDEPEITPEPIVTPQEVQRINLDVELINQTLEQANQIIDTPEIEVEVSNNWNEPQVEEQVQSPQETEEELKKKVQNS
jgi:hypothetical protein